MQCGNCCVSIRDLYQEFLKHPHYLSARSMETGTVGKVSPYKDMKIREMCMIFCFSQDLPNFPGGRAWKEENAAALLGEKNKIKKQKLIETREIQGQVVSINLQLGAALLGFTPGSWLCM